MSSYQKTNTILGWIVFSIASIVYILTAEPTASFWDCGEYIATAYKLQVGHPPGAPLFQMIGRFFSLFAFGDTSRVAFMVNMMSAFSSSFTILFLFWTLTMLAKKLALKTGEITESKNLVIFGSALVGSLAYTFSDSFWFSAAEGEVYAMSSFFTALVFWAILKWDEKADEPHAFRWLIFIAFMVGLSIGVHLLNLLAIPAIAFVYYFRKYKNPNPKGFAITLIVSLLLLALIMNGIIPWIVLLAGKFELLFVNNLGLPFNSGTIFYFIVLIGGIYWGIRYTRKKQKPVYNAMIWGFTFILIGYSSFILLVIRSNAGTPINENSPKDAISLLAYLNREQYGDWPKLHGQYFNAPVIDRYDGNPVYKKDTKAGKYVIIDKREDINPVYDPEFTTIFPRMWNNQEARYANDYKKWSEMRGVKVQVTDEAGEQKILEKPTFKENLRYFFRYQLNHMYFRYFMWNFSGRQNDFQGLVNRTNGNWISGIKFIDHARLGPVLNIPDSLKNKAMNKFYMLPLLLGLLGLVYQFRKDYKNGMVISLLFIMTGLAIVVYLNQHSPQPRERDYAYAASFYAFSMWIGLGVFALFDILRNYIKAKTTVYLVTGLTLLLVPGIMAKEGWDDHDRSNRYTALAMANNYLNSCAHNAILFTNGDNDTFPLWYAQEVEGIRTDVRVVNLSLLNTDWYIDQMKQKVYESEPLPISLPWEQYKSGKRAYTYFINQDNIKGHVDIQEIFQILNTDPEKLTFQSRIGPLDYFPTKKFKLRIDSAQIIKTGTVSPSYADKIVDEITWTVKGSGISKNHLMVLDLIANNNWERPIYFAITTGNSSYVGLEDYFQMEGMTYRLVPIKVNRSDGQVGMENTEAMFDHLMNKYMFGNLNDPGVYLDETNVRMTMNLRSNFGRLTNQLIKEGKLNDALLVMDRIMQEIPDEVVPFDYFVLPMAEGYYKIGKPEKGQPIFNRVIDIKEERLEYYFQFTGKNKDTYDYEKQQSLSLLRQVILIAQRENIRDIEERAAGVFDKYYDIYIRK
jgi:hypothetical protein